MEEQRIPFPDYPVKEQEHDAKKAKNKNIKEVYVMRVNGDWGAIMPRPRHNLIFNADKGVELTKFIENLRKDFKEFGWKARFHNVMNYGIECKIAEYQHPIRKERNNGRD